jgi:hypothetical protein
MSTYDPTTASAPTETSAASATADAPAATGNVVNDAKTDASNLIADARTAAKAEVDAAASAIDKLLATAAGDVAPLLTEAEGAAVPLVLSKIPSPLASVVGSFVQAALAGTESTLNGTANADAAKGLAYAEAEVKSLQTHLESVL